MVTSFIQKAQPVISRMVSSKGADRLILLPFLHYTVSINQHQMRSVAFCTTTFAILFLQRTIYINSFKRVQKTLSILRTNVF